MFTVKGELNQNSITGPIDWNGIINKKGREKNGRRALFDSISYSVCLKIMFESC